MKIQVLGSGCAKCVKLAENAKKAVALAGVSAEVEKITDVKTIAQMKVLFTPGLLIDGKVKSTGKVPDPEQIMVWIRQASE